MLEGIMGTSTKMRKLKRQRAKHLATVARLHQVQNALEHFRIMNDVTAMQLEAERWRELSRYTKISDAVEAYQSANASNFEMREIEKAAAFQRDLHRTQAFERDWEKVSTFQREMKNALDYQRELDQATIFQRDLQHAARLQHELKNAASIHSEFEKVMAFQREFDTVSAFERHLEKASAFQMEIDRAAAFRLDVDTITKLTDEMKSQTFARMRDENYRASLRLEGLQPSFTTDQITLAALKAKYVR